MDDLPFDENGVWGSEDGPTVPGYESARSHELQLQREELRMDFYSKVFMEAFNGGNTKNAHIAAVNSLALFDETFKSFVG